MAQSVRSLKGQLTKIRNILPAARADRDEAIRDARLARNHVAHLEREENRLVVALSREDYAAAKAHGKTPRPEPIALPLDIDLDSEEIEKEEIEEEEEEEEEDETLEETVEEVVETMDEEESENDSDDPELDGPTEPLEEIELVLDE